MVPAKAMHDSDQPTDNILPQRLCSEIQLFDLCDLDSCTFKNGRFCIDPLLLGRFEKISENELRSPERFVSEDIDDEEATDTDGYDEEDEFAEDEFDGSEDED